MTMTWMNPPRILDVVSEPAWRSEPLIYAVRSFEKPSPFFIQDELYRTAVILVDQSRYDSNMFILG